MQLTIERLEEIAVLLQTQERWEMHPVMRNGEGRHKR
jgi:hypothetical protein